MDTRTRASHRNKQHPANKAIKQADLELLKIAQEEGLICLKYLDESGFCLWSPVSYSYVKKGEQKPLKGLYFFFLPKYCSQMNLIEPEWHQLKTHELAGRMFEDEYDASERCYGRNRRKKPASRILHRAL